MTSTQKYQDWNKRAGSPTFAYTLPADWCKALMCLGGGEQHAKAEAWRELLGLPHAFYASEVFEAIPEIDNAGACCATHPCRTYHFTR